MAEMVFEAPACVTTIHNIPEQSNLELLAQWQRDLKRRHGVPCKRADFTFRDCETTSRTQVNRTILNL